MILEGNATIIFPATGEILPIKSGLLYAAADTADVSAIGHITTVHRGSRLVQFPFKDGVIPDHTTVHGECPKAIGSRDEL